MHQCAAVRYVIFLLLACCGEATPTPRSPSNPSVSQSGEQSWLLLDPAFPFVVDQVWVVGANPVGARWGAHGGPLVTTGAYSSEQSVHVIRFGAQVTETVLPLPADIPSQLYWGPEGLIEDEDGHSMLSYSTPGAPFTGELLLFGTTIERHKVNGIYSSVFLAGGDCVYSGLSPLDATHVVDNGLYSCNPSQKLFGWSGMSGPVATDIDGNIFVAASLFDADSSDAIFALMSGEKKTLAKYNTFGTQSLAVGSQWMLVVPFSAESVLAFSYSGDEVPVAIRPANPEHTLSVLNDSQGQLWVAISGGAFAKLKKR